jgi:hypothetical protein
MVATERDGPMTCGHCGKTGHIMAFCKEKPIQGPDSNEVNVTLTAVGIDSDDSFRQRRLNIEGVHLPHFVPFYFSFVMCWVRGGVLEFGKWFGVNCSTSCKHHQGGCVHMTVVSI